MRLLHMGDVGEMPAPSYFEKIGKIDILMIPVGGYYTIDARQARRLAQELRPRVTIPMHYRGAGFGYDVIAPQEDYLALCGGDNVVRYPGNALELTRDTPAQTAVLACPHG